MPGARVPWDLSAYHQRVRAACFICELVAGTAGYEHHVVHDDDQAVAFLSKYPQLWGHTLVAPRSHREHVIGDFTTDDYLGLQALIHRIGRALIATVPTERLYVLSLGSQQGNRHVHWHLLPLPPGVPYDEQQIAVLDEANGWIDAADQDMAALARRLQAAIHR